MLNRLLVIISVLIIAVSCTSAKKAQKTDLENSKPEWVLKKPISSSYYYGIGNANMNTHSKDFQQIAKNKALEDLSSEIEVTIDAQSVLSTKETSLSFIENYQATTRIDVKNNLSEFEAVESWVNENEYWVLYRLSKSRYQELEAERKNKAINEALHFLNESDKALTYKLQFEYLLQGLDAIKSYLNDPLKTERNSQTIYLGNYILSSINSRLSKLKLIKAKNSLLLNWNNCFTEEATFSLQYNDIPVEDIPVRVKYNSYASQKMISDENGFVKYEAKANFYDDLPTKMDAWIYTSDLIKDPLIAELFEKEYSPVYMDVNLDKPYVFVNTSRDRGAFQEIIEKAGAKISPDSASADIYLDARFKTVSVGKSNDFYTSSCSIEMKVYNSDHELIEKKIWPEVKGVHTNKLSADNKASENAVKQIKYTWIQKLIMEHCRD